ncbi:MAG: hypothetical protein WDO15_17365 [Bacteroidota bacterium]
MRKHCGMNGHVVRSRVFSQQELGLAAFGAVFFVGLFYLQNKLIDTPAEKQLRTENRALKAHYKVLSANWRRPKATFRSF